ncbi:MAG: M48 family metalloprotease [Rhodocyclaceae bacterium]|nr:M48 family metalloprotease [Rhodocyclaceae bacterium]
MKPRPRLALRTWRRLLPAAVCAALCACASTGPGGRSQLTAPTPISSLYSSLDMDLRLATATSIEKACAGIQCRIDKGFDQQVARLGARLASAAYAANPDLRQRVPAFHFVVAEKSEAGSASDSQGNIVIFRGVRQPDLDEKALAFVMAREMGHVIARHHEEKSATGVMLSVLMQILMPLTNLTGGLAALTGSMASAVGTQVVSADKEAERRQEADAIAYDLLGRQGWSSDEIVASLARYAKDMNNDAWSQTVRQSLVQLEKARHAKMLVAKT